MSLDKSVFPVSTLSSHSDHHKKIGAPKDCTFLSSNSTGGIGILSKEMFDIIKGVKAPNLAGSEQQENSFLNRQVLKDGPSNHIRRQSMQEKNK
jgi:hypothetical protein